MTGYIFDLIRMMLMGLPVYIVLRYLLLLRRARRLGEKAGGRKVKLKFNKLREVFLGLFVVFMIALLAFVWQGAYAGPVDMLRYARYRLRTQEGINLIPFQTIRNYYRVYGIHGDMFGINIVGNVLMFVPWGFGLLFLWKKNREFFRFLYFSAILPILIECSQLFIARQVDVDDFILNFCGALAGGLLYVVLAGIFPKLRTAAL